MIQLTLCNVIWKENKSMEMKDARLLWAVCCVMMSACGVAKAAQTAAVMMRLTDDWNGKESSLIDSASTAIES